MKGEVNSRSFWLQFHYSKAVLFVLAFQMILASLSMLFLFRKLIRNKGCSRSGTGKGEICLTYAYDM